MNRLLAVFALAITLPCQAGPPQKPIQPFSCRTDLTGKIVCSDGTNARRDITGATRFNNGMVCRKDISGRMVCK